NFPQVFIAADQKDYERAAKLREKFRNERCTAFVLATQLKQASPRAIRKDFHDKVGMADAIVFLYGDAPVEFINGWLTEYCKYYSPGQERIEAIYHAPPPPGMIYYDWPGLLSIGSRADFTLGDAEKIVAELRREVR